MNEQINIESLIGKYSNDTISDDERRELISWIAQSRENEVMFNQIREILLVSKINDPNFQFDVQAALERVRTKARLNRTIPRLREENPRKTITLSYHWAAVVAILLVISGTLFYRWMPQPAGSTVAYQEIIVPLGSRSKVVLPDGSHVNLNAGSTLRYNIDFGDERRDLFLDGEAFFDVHKSATPFIVHSGAVQIKAVGTSFNVCAYSSGKTIETTLVNGKVIVTDTNQQELATEGITLLPNQKLIISRQNTDSAILKEMIDPTPDISWKDNKWIIHREDLESLSVKLERRFDVKIVFRDEQLKSYRYNGSLPDLSLEQVLNVMRLASPVQYSINGKTIIFFEKKDKY